MGKPVPVEINHVKTAGNVRITWDDNHSVTWSGGY